MNKYDNFEFFIDEIINEANNQTVKASGKDIDALYHSNVPICNIVKKLLSKGWNSFVSVVTITDLSDYNYANATKSFLTTPVGIEINKIQQDYKDLNVIKQLTINKKFPINIKKFGEGHKNDFESHINEISYIDNKIKNIAKSISLKMSDKTLE